MEKDVVNVIVGDSIAYGYGDNELFGWHNRLRKKSPKLAKQIYFNLSIPGQCSIDIVKRFKQEFLARFNDIDDFNVIFAFGIKDALKLSKDIEHKEIFEKNVQNLISFTQKYTNKIIFLGLLDVDIKIRPNYNIENIKIIDCSLKMTCDKNNVKYIKMSGIVPLDDLIDGLHPNENGYQKICDYLQSNLE